VAVAVVFGGCTWASATEEGFVSFAEVANEARFAVNCCCVASSSKVKIRYYKIL
jgi:hypothetical protein